MKGSLEYTQKNGLIVKLIHSLKQSKRGMSRWKFKRACVIFLIIFIFPIAIYLYAFQFEPKSLSITWTDIESPNIPKGFQGVKIVQFSDTHFGPNFSHEQQKKLVDQINELKPDIVVFTGDLIDKFEEYGSERKDTQTILSQIRAPLGKYAVFGNHDRGEAEGICTNSIWRKRVLLFWSMKRQESRQTMVIILRFLVLMTFYLANPKCNLPFSIYKKKILTYC